MKYTLLFTFLLFGFNTMAQNPSVHNKIFTGKVAGAIDQVTIPYATVNLLKEDSSIVKSVLTNPDGKFEIRGVQQGKYFIKVIFQGYVPFISKMITSLDTVTIKDLGIIYLKSDTHQLNQVNIKSRAPVIEQKIDRLVFNVENVLTATGGDALDALKVTPGVNIQDNQIGLIGKTSVIVMIDDRKVSLSGENLTSFLSSIKTNDIKSIEVISNPPSKYEAEGNSGIINIRLKKAKADSWNATLQSAYTQSTYANGSGGGNFTYNKDKLSFVFNADYKNGSRKRTESDKIYYPDQFWNTDFTKRIYTNSLSLRTGLDYQINRSWTTGIQYLGSFSNPKVDENDLGTITGTNHLQPDSLLNTVAKSMRKIHSNSLNWHSDFKLDTAGKLITLNFDYFNFSNHVNRDFSTQSQLPDGSPIPDGELSTNNIGEQNVDNYSFKADIDLPYKWINLSLGGKLSFTNTENNLNYYNTTSGSTILNADQSNAFNYREDTQALYISGNKTIMKKWLFQAGLRMENTDTRGNSLTYNQVNDTNYLQFFPTFYTSYKLNQANTFSLNYGRRIERPGFADLNPFKFYSSTYSYTTGNPSLRPQYSNLLEFKYNYNNLFYTTISYTNENHGFGSVPFVDDQTKVQYFMDLNYYTYNSAGISEYYTFNKLKWWESNNQINIYHTKSSFSSGVNLNNTQGWGAYYSTNNSFQLNKANSLKGGVNFWYQSAVYDLLYKKTDHSSLDLALKYAPSKSHFQIALIAQDVLKKDISEKTTYDNQVKQVYGHYDDSRILRLALSYKIGNNKIKSKNRSFGNEDEKGRTN